MWVKCTVSAVTSPDDIFLWCPALHILCFPRWVFPEMLVITVCFYVEKEDGVETVWFMVVWILVNKEV